MLDGRQSALLFRKLAWMRKLQLERPAQPDGGGNYRIDQRIERGITQRFEHRGHVGSARPEVAGDEWAEGRQPICAR